jgi:uncharacterized protein YjbI with pentapeptide repeats
MANTIEIKHRFIDVVLWTGKANSLGDAVKKAIVAGICLGGADLFGANLGDANLGDADLRGADLYGVNLCGANLHGANLHGAYLGEADLFDANLRGANLGGASLRGANLGGANLSGTDLGGATLRGANLSGANLSGANLSGANLSGADLSDANLSGANLSGANLSGANLRDANLRDANLRDANFGGADLRGANLRDANLRDANFGGADLRGAKNVSDSVSENLSARTPETHEQWKARRDEERKDPTIRARRNRERALAYRTSNPDVPVVEHLDMQIFQAVTAVPASFDMSHWHRTTACGTTHCRAGYAVHLAGPGGYQLEKKLGSAEFAGRAIYLASEGYVPHFFGTTERALEDIRLRAKESADYAAHLALVVT